MDAAEVAGEMEWTEAQAAGAAAPLPEQPVTGTPAIAAPQQQGHPPNLPGGQRPPGSAWIAACPVAPYSGPVVVEECMTRLEAVELDTGALLFYADSRDAGSTCFAWVPLGTRVELRTEVAHPSCRLAYWRPGFEFSEGMPCACADTSSSTCRFTVQGNAYCGAVFELDLQ